jgi:hypothetical protein
VEQNLNWLCRKWLLAIYNNRAKIKTKNPLQQSCVEFHGEHFEEKFGPNQCSLQKVNFFCAIDLLCLKLL